MSLSIFLWVERPQQIHNPKNLPELRDQNNKIYRWTSLDDYSAMVRDKEMPVSFPKQARIVQEILARSYFIKNRKNLVQSTDLFQVFQFQNIVISFMPNKIIENISHLEYHSRCPGFIVTENGSKISCPLHKNNPYIWTYRIPSSEFKLKDTVTKILKSSDLNQKRLFRLPFRDKLQSVYIDSFNPASGKVVGRGMGHGVGLCQWGAKYMAEQGFSYNEIIKFYYPNSFLKDI